MASNKPQKGKSKIPPLAGKGVLLPDVEELANREKAERYNRQQQDHDLIRELQNRQTKAEESQAQSNRSIVRLTAALVIVALVSGLISALQFWVAKKSAEAAGDAVNVARETLIAMQQGQSLQERPWVKVSHRIIAPLTFDVGGRASGKTVALMTVENTITNVGKSVAVNVKSWEDLIPMGADFSLTAAQNRQKEWCEANRFQQGSLTGEVLFPDDPIIQHSIVGPTMERIYEVVNTPGNTAKGKIGFVLVGCVLYKAAFEDPTTPAHKTGFMYFVGTQDGGGINTYIFPRGVAPQLQLISMPLGHTAD